MGKNKVEGPKKLAGKLRRIRLKSGLPQSEMATALEEYDVRLDRSCISSYENESRLPPLLVMLAYARFAKFPSDVLFDDKLDLPKGF